MKVSLTVTIETDLLNNGMSSEDIEEVFEQIAYRVENAVASVLNCGTMPIDVELSD